MSRLTDEDRADLLLFGAVERVTWVIRSARASRALGEDRSEPRSGAPSRWSRVRPIAPFIGKFLDECSVEDLRAVVAAYDSHIAGMERERDRYAALLASLEREGAATVADLGVAVAA